MTDERQRDRARRWQETGAAEDEAAFLRDQVRAGVLAEDRFRLAEACGHAGLGGPEREPLAFGAWLAQLPFRQGPRGLERDWTRVPVAIARALAPCADQLGAGGRLRGSLAVIEPVLVHGGRPFPPDSPERAALLLHRSALRDTIEDRWPDTREALPPEVAILLVIDAALGHLLDGDGDPAPLEGWCQAALYPEGVFDLEPWVEAALESRFPRQGGRLWHLRLAVRDELVPWALNRADPVRARLEV